MMNAIHALTSIFGSMMLLVIVFGGFLFMFSPDRAKQLFKNTALSLLLFVFGTMLLQAVCSATKHSVR